MKSFINGIIIFGAIFILTILPTHRPFHRVPMPADAGSTTFQGSNNMAVVAFDVPNPDPSANLSIYQKPFILWASGKITDSQGTRVEDDGYALGDSNSGQQDIANTFLHRLPNSSPVKGPTSVASGIYIKNNPNGYSWVYILYKDGSLKNPGPPINVASITGGTNNTALPTDRFAFNTQQVYPVTNGQWSYSSVATLYTDCSAWGGAQCMPQQNATVYVSTFGAVPPHATNPVPVAGGNYWTVPWSFPRCPHGESASGLQNPPSYQNPSGSYVPYSNFQGCYDSDGLSGGINPHQQTTGNTYQP